MDFFSIAAFMLLIAAIFSLFRASPISILRDIQNYIQRVRSGRKLDMRQKIKQSVKKRRIRGIQKILLDARNVLVLTHRTDKMKLYVTASIILFLAGILISSLLQNYFLMPVLAGGMALLPWLYILLNSISFQKQLNEELETTLSIITTSYERSGDFKEAVEKSIDNIHYPIREIFDKFLVQTKVVSPDLPKLLEEMKSCLNNAIFQDWVDQIILCLRDRSLRSTLQPIISRFSTVRDVSGKLDNLMYESVWGYIKMAAVLVLNYPLLKLMFPDWYDLLMHQTTGQIIVAATFLTLFASLSALIGKTRPVEDRR